MTDKLDDLTNVAARDILARELETKRAEVQALAQRESALIETIRELEERIGDHLENLKVKARLEELQRAALKFADSIP